MRKAAQRTALALSVLLLVALLIGAQQTRPALPPIPTVQPPPPTLASPNPQEAAPKAPPPAPRPRPAILLDAAHGGDERGAALADNINEKDVTLALAKRVRAELANRGIVAVMTREGDATLTPDQRAEAANTLRPQLYVALHASSAGAGLRIYTAVMPQTETGPPSLVPWDRAQQNSLDTSQAIAESLAADLAGKNIPSAILGAPLRPLNNVIAPALAVEMAPPPGGRASIDMLQSPQYQQRIAAALAAALISARNKLGGAQ